MAPSPPPPAPHDGSLGVRARRASFDRALLDSLGPLGWVMGPLYLFFVVVDRFTLPSGARDAVPLADLAAALVFLAVAVAVRARQVPARAAHPVAAVLALAAIANSFVALVTHPAPAESATNIVIAMGVGLFFLSWPWLAAALVLNAGVWLAAAVPAYPEDPSNWMQQGWALLATTALAAVAHGTRLQLHGRVDALRAQDRARLAELEAQTEARERAASLLRGTLESTTDGILVVDRAGKVSSFNGRFLALWRIPEELAATRDDERLLGFVLSQLREPEAFLRKVRDLYADPHAESFDMLEFRDGRVFERYSRPQRLGAEVVGRVWSFRDVTERREAERTARDADAKQREVDRLREMDRFKTQFLSTVSHELNTPLTPLKLQLHLLKGHGLGPLNGEQRRAMEMLDRNVERLALLVQDMLDVARLQNGRLKLAPKRVRLAAAVNDAVVTFQESAKQAGVALAERVVDGLHVHADPQRVAQVLHNLLSNAIKYTPRGGTIRVEMGRDGDMAVVRVRDSGVGLAPEQMARLFQPFTQVHDTSRQSRPGTGLGLYISKGIVEEHGGRIWVESRGAGMGSTFGFGIPLAGEEGAQPPASEPIAA